MYYNDENVVISMDPVTIKINPTCRIAELKNEVMQQKPSVEMRWDRHQLFFRDLLLDDTQQIYAAGIFHNDIVEIIAIPQRRPNIPVMSIRD